MSPSAGNFGADEDLCKGCDDVAESGDEVNRRLGSTGGKGRCGPLK